MGSLQGLNIAHSKVTTMSQTVCVSMATPEASSDNNEKEREKDGGSQREVERDRER